jgi:hypothetical protein
MSYKAQPALHVPASSSSVKTLPANSAPALGTLASSDRGSRKRSRKDVLYRTTPLADRSFMARRPRHVAVAKRLERGASSGHRQLMRSRQRNSAIYCVAELS